MSLSIITAMTDDRVIGRDNQLPWNLPEDTQHFKRLTTGHAVIMGRKTYDSMGKPLPKRTNIVVTHDRTMKIPGAIIAHSFEEAVKKGYEVDPNPFVVGGTALYEKAMPVADELYLTMIHRKIAGDAYFPEFSLKDFDIVQKTDHVSEGKEKLPFTFLYARRKKITSPTAPSS